MLQRLPKPIFLLIALIVVLPVIANAQLQTIREEIGKIIRYESGIDFEIVPGLVIGVWDQADTAYFTYGRGVTTDDWFELGSLTKPVTAYFTYGAMESLGYERSTSLCTFIPDTLCSGQWKALTIKQIIEHMAGLPRVPGNMGIIETSAEDPYRAYDVHRLIKDIKQLEPVPGRYAYSHIGYAALHWVFERLGGFEAFVNVGLQTAGCSMAVNQDENVLTQGYGFDGKPAEAWHAAAMKPALGLRGTAPALLEFIMQQQDALAKTYPGLTADLKRELGVWDRMGGYKVESGWFLIRSGKSLVFYHNGRTGGHQVSVAFMPAEKKGVVVFANGTAGSNDLSLSILTMLRRAKN